MAKTPVVRDVLWTEGEFIPFEAPRQDTRHTHGTGCTLATAIACGLAQKLPLREAVGRARRPMCSRRSGPRRVLGKAPAR